MHMSNNGLLGFEHMYFNISSVRKGSQGVDDLAATSAVGRARGKEKGDI